MIIIHVVKIIIFSRLFIPILYIIIPQYITNFISSHNYVLHMHQIYELSEVRILVFLQLLFWLFLLDPLYFVVKHLNNFFLASFYFHEILDLMVQYFSFYVSISPIIYLINHEIS